MGKKFEIIDLDSYALSVRDVYRCRSKDCDDDCNNRCVAMHNIKFPAFLEQYQLVAYKEYNKINYGILPYKMNDGADDSYVIDLNNNGFISNREEPKDKDDYRIFDAHWHPSYLNIYVPERKDVPDNIYDNYLYAVEVLKKLDYNSDGLENIHYKIIF